MSYCLSVEGDTQLNLSICGGPEVDIEVDCKCKYDLDKSARFFYVKSHKDREEKI